MNTKPLVNVLLMTKELLTIPLGGKYNAAGLSRARSCLPYTWQGIPGTPYAILCGREYAPMGAVPWNRQHEAWEPEEYPHLHIHRALLPLVDDLLRDRWFYDDSCSPWNGKHHAERLVYLIDRHIDMLNMYTITTCPQCGGDEPDCEFCVGGAVPLELDTSYQDSSVPVYISWRGVSSESSSGPCPWRDVPGYDPVTKTFLVHSRDGSRSWRERVPDITGPDARAYMAGNRPMWIMMEAPA